jgi:acetylornithine deacetylase
MELSGSVPTADAPFAAEEFDSWWRDRREEIVGRLLDLIAIPTVSPDEERCYPWLGAQISALGGSWRVEPPPQALPEHPDFTLTEFSGRPRANLRARLPGPPGAPRLLLNVHVDVVPAKGFEGAFQPRFSEGRVVGRGAADTKNNIVMALAALEFLRDLGIAPAYDLQLDFVVEEEIGGSGTLASILNACTAEEVVVLEPTSLEIFHGHRGCLSFEVLVKGIAGHMGGGGGLSAIDGAVEAIEALKGLERRLSELARAEDLFGAEPPPTVVNVGSIDGGEWHGSFPDRCLLRANAGFLPPLEIAGVKELIEEAVGGLADPWGGRCEVTYSGIHNDAYAIDPRTPLVRRLLEAKRRQGLPEAEPAVWGASCDARYYARLAGLPVVVFGSGDLDHAHGVEERLEISQLAAGTRILADFLATPPGRGPS